MAEATVSYHPSSAASISAKLTGMEANAHLFLGFVNISGPEKLKIKTIFLRQTAPHSIPVCMLSSAQLSSAQLSSAQLSSAHVLVVSSGDFHMDLSFLLLLCLPLSSSTVPQNLLTLVSSSSFLLLPPNEASLFSSRRSGLVLGVFICAVCLFRPSSSVAPPPPPPPLCLPHHPLLPPPRGLSFPAFVLAVMLTSGGGVFSL